MQPAVGRRSPEYDVAVVGAGPAGSASAILLAEVGHRVLLVDRARFPRPKPCAEYASPGTERLLARLGVLERVDRGLGRRLRGMELVAPGGARFLVEYRHNRDARAAFALPREQLDAELVARARERGVEVWEGFRVHSVARCGERVVGVESRVESSESTAENGELDSRRSTLDARLVSARLVVGADGAHSTVARTLGLNRGVRWPRRMGLAAHYGGVDWPEDYGQMWVGQRGYVGAAPTGDGRVIVGLAAPLPPRRLGPTELAFRAALEQFPPLAARLARGRRLGPIRGVGPMARAVQGCSGAGYLLVGDAAGFLDPFTGEGIYRALRGAELAAEVADRALRAGDLSAERLREYETLRRKELGPKERLTRLVQLFVQLPALMDYVLPRLERRPAPTRTLSLALGDLVPASQALRPAVLWGLLRP